MVHLSDKEIIALVQTLNFNQYLWPTLCPLKFTPHLTWRALQAEIGVPVAADVVSYNATAPRKTRRVVSKATGDIPKISIAREKTENELNEYNSLLQYAQTTEGGQALIDYVYDDLKFVWDGVSARLEWLMLRGLSTGKVSLDAANNNGIVTETAVDFLIPSAQKAGVSVVWSLANKATALPISNIKAAVAAMKKKGKKVNYMLMDQTTFDILAVCDETVKFASSWVLSATSLTQTPSLASVNAALSGAGLPMIKIVDTYVTIEKNDGTQTVVSPFETGAVCFLPSLTPGRTYNAPLADENINSSQAFRVKQGPVLIKKYAVEEPLTEVTIGMANAFPVISEAMNMYLLDTLHGTFTF